MGCSNGCTNDPSNPKRFHYPVCALTYPINETITSAIAIDKSRILMGLKDVMQIFDFDCKSITDYSKEHVGRVNMFLRLKNGNIASVGQDKTIKIWDMEKDKSLATMTGHTSMIWAISELPNGNLITGGDDKKIKVWDMKEYKEMFNLYEGDTECSCLLALSDDVILSSHDNKLNLFNFTAKDIIGTYQLKANAWFFYILKDGNIAAGLGNGEIWVFNITNNQMKLITKLIGGHKRSITYICQLNNGLVVTTSDENNMIGWNLKDPDNKYILEGHNAAITSSTCTDDGKIISFARDNQLKVWV